MKTCEAPDCDVEFEPQRSTAKFHSATCRQRAARAKKAAESSVESDAAEGKAEHPLVRAVRSELEAADKADSFNGQLALQLARRLANPEEKASTALSKELREVMSAALGTPAPLPAGDGPAPEAEVDDEVTKARRAREQARQAAGLA